MTTPFWCVLLAFVLVWLSRIPVMVALARRKGGYDNKHPHRQMRRLDGWGGRAVSAQQGLMEGFGPFAAAVIVAHLCGADPRRAGVLAIAFVVCEVVYVVAYVADVDYLRVFVWLIGLFAVLGLFALSV